MKRLYSSIWFWIGMQCIGVVGFIVAESILISNDRIELLFESLGWFSLFETVTLASLIFCVQLSRERMQRLVGLSETMSYPEMIDATIGMFSEYYDDTRMQLFIAKVCAGIIHHQHLWEDIIVKLKTRGVDDNVIGIFRDKLHLKFDTSPDRHFVGLVSMFDVIDVPCPILLEDRIFHKLKNAFIIDGVTNEDYRRIGVAFVSFLREHSSSEEYLGWLWADMFANTNSRISFIKCHRVDMDISEEHFNSFMHGMRQELRLTHKDTLSGISIPTRKLSERDFSLWQSW